MYGSQYYKKKIDSLALEESELSVNYVAESWRKLQDTMSRTAEKENAVDG